jgi:aspartyl-tRNA(Asn)/glutamyl-tRNA(Gln) amidotransferase subunit C
MQVTDEMIRKLAGLSRLEFREEEFFQIRSDLEKMISFVDKINELDLSGVEPLLHVTDAKDVFREDVAEPSLSKKDALSNAQIHDDHFFKVPKVFRKTT